ncbi:uncharacterized protein LOC141607951 [Silene latifolia]|uniref:uncharacterized protein LOC141607951 n=1 Tax=Silene latifolia TaxID=37657 RepID=UPI003D76ABB8
MDSSWSWRKICQVKDIMNQLHNQGDGPGSYSIKHGYNSVREIRPVVPWFHQVWSSWTVPKHRIIAWLSYQNALNTRAKLYRLGVSDRDTCCICEQGTETLQHLFFGCEYSNKILTYLENWLGIKVSRIDAFQWLLMCRFTRLKKRIIRAVMNAYLYTIWHQRNVSELEMKAVMPIIVALKIRKLVQDRCSPNIRRPVGAKDVQWIERFEQR